MIRPRPLRRGRARALAALAAAGALVGCAGGRVDLDELPAAPIAVVYWDANDARDRAEQRADAERERGARGEWRREGVATAEGLAALLPGRRRGRERFPGRLALVDPLSGDVEMVEQATLGARPLAWSDDGCCLLFSSTQRGGRELFEWDRTTGEVRQLTHGPGASTLGDYGPDRRLVYARVTPGEGAESRLYVTGPGGAAPRRLGRGTADHSPVWSPDGSTIVFVREDPDRGSVLMARGPEPDAEEHVLGRGHSPVFSHGGDWIVYVAPTRAGMRLWRSRPDGSGKLPLGRGRFEERSPAVSPDDRFVAYVAEEQLRERLSVRRFDGTGDRVLLDDGDGAWPVW